MTGIWFVPANVLAVFLAGLAATGAYRGRASWRGALAALGGFVVVVQLVLLATGTLAVLTAPVVAGCLAVAGVLAGGMGWRRPVMASTVVEEPDPAPERGLEVAAALLLIVPWVLLAGRAVFTGIEFGPDGATYHGPAPAHWLVDGRLSLTPFGPYVYYPLNAELLTLWWMLPFGTDAFVTLGGFYWGTVLIGAAVALGFGRGLSRSSTLLSAACLLASPTIMAAARSIAAVDLAAPAMTLAAIAMLSPTPGDPGAPVRRADALYGGLFAGFAAGCKVSFLPVPVLLLAWLAVRELRGSGSARSVRTLGLFLLAALLTGGYWYGRNLLLTGNPLYPAAVGPFAGPFGAREQAATRLSTWLFTGALTPGAWRMLLGQYLDWPEGLAGLAILGFATALSAGRPAADAGPRGGRPLTQVLLLVGLALALLYPFTPFSATNDSAGAPLRVERRFLLAPVAIGLLLLAPRLETGRRWCWVWRAACVGAVLQGWRRLDFATLTHAVPALWWRGPGGARLLECCAVAGLAAYALARRRMSPRLRACALGAVAVLACSALWLRAPLKLGLNDLRVTSIGGPAFDQLPPGSGVAWYGEHRYAYYPLFGRRFQFRPRMPAWDGAPYAHFHEREARGEDAPWWPAARPEPGPASFVRNLRVADVQFVVLTPIGGAPPPQEAVLRASSGVDLLFADGQTTLWRIRP